MTDLMKTSFTFDFNIEFAVPLPDSVMAFHKHGIQVLFNKKRNKKNSEICLFLGKIFFPWLGNAGSLRSVENLQSDWK